MYKKVYLRKKCGLTPPMCSWHLAWKTCELIKYNKILLACSSLRDLHPAFHSTQSCVMSKFSGESCKQSIALQLQFKLPSKNRILVKCTNTRLGQNYSVNNCETKVGISLLLLGCYRKKRNMGVENILF